MVHGRQIEELDEVAARAVPAAEAQDIAGWIARCSPGLATKRANSVWPRTHTGEPALDAKLAQVERFYSDRELPVRYQLSPTGRPTGLERVLRQRGYVPSAPSAVARCELAVIAARSAPPRWATTIDARPSGRWWATWQQALSIDPARQDAVLSLFDRVRTPMAFVTVTIDGLDVAVAAGILDWRWIGIFNMATLPQHQGRGAARTALRALADWALQRNATISYLQVDLDNESALDLYRRVGFQIAYQYSYLTRECQP